MLGFFDTIVARATPIGESAIAIVRLSGSHAVRIADSFTLCSRIPSLQDLAPRLFANASIRSGVQIVDHCLCVRFAAPASFTGEDIVELHLHGNPLIVDLVLRLSVEAGARLAEAGEFTRRAFVNGKLDLTQVEGLGLAIRAESERALFYAQRHLHGELSDRFGIFRSRLVRLLSLFELELDFSEEGYSLSDRREVLALVESLRAEVDLLLSSFRSGARLLRGPRVVLMGLPNAGKSSLFNAIVGYSRALVSDVAGTTRDYIEERIVHDGVVLHFIDTAGVRDSADAIEAAGVGKALDLIGVVDHLVFLIDSSGDHSMSEALIRQFGLEGQEAVFTRVYTKSDLVAPPGGCRSISILDPGTVTGLLDYLITEYRSVATDALSLLSRRQFDLLTSLRSQLAEVDWQTLDAELLSYELRSVLAPLEQLAGAVVSDDVLNEIFSSFCIGK